jgi:hypothetical protein
MKDSYLHIVPECYVDTNLVQILMQIKGVNHQNSCGQVTLTEFGIPDDLEGLKNVTKSKNCLDNNDLRRAIKAVSSSSEMQLLTDVLNYLQTNKYNSNSDELIDIFKVHGFMK